VISSTEGNLIPNINEVKKKKSFDTKREKKKEQHMMSRFKEQLGNKAVRE
jgi:hypothetical protein